MSLTNGVINEILCTPDPENLPANPVVQVLGVKKLPAQSGGQERYRLVLSDGVHYYTSAMLGTQLNDRVGEDSIEVKSVIQITRYTCNVIQETRRIIIILDLDIVNKASEMSGKIGEPVQMSDLVANHVNLKSAIKKEPQPPPSNSNQPLRSNNPTPVANRPSPYASSNQSNTSVQKPYSGGAGANASAGGKNVFPIVSLTPYQNRWTIRARITSKSNIRTWSNSRGEGKLFSVDLVDESGEIRATGFNNVVDKYYDMLEQGKVYYFTKGSLKTANKKYTSLKNDYEMSLNDDTLIEPCLEECDLPSVQYNFMPIKDIEQVNKDSIIDIIGVVKLASEVSQITTKATNKQVSKRDITIVDQSKAAIRATLWGQDAENFSEYASRFPVLAIKGAKVSDFGGRSLSIPSSSNFSINPDIPEAHTLRGWYDNGGADEQTSSLSGQGSGDSMGGTYKTIAQIKEENLGAGEKADFFNVRASIVFLKKENCLYQACPGAECNKKVNEENGQYRCEKCDRTYPDFKYRLMLQSNIADHTGNQWITSFQDSAEVILGTKSDQLGKLREENENEFDKIFSDASFTPFILKVRAKHETYQDESKLKCVTVAANPIDYKRECNRLIGEIKQLAAK